MRRLRFRTTFLIVTIALVAGPKAHSLQRPTYREAQSQTPAAAGTGLLMGAIVDSLTDRPVAASVVTLGGDRKVLTDSQGRFVFGDLPKGTYTITAAKAGYADGAYGRQRPAGPAQGLPLAEDERIGDLKITIWKHASIAGTITDETGEPMVDVPVRILARAFVAGRRKLAPGVIVRTDDRGVYRLGALIPADYAVVVPSTQTSAPESIVDLYRQTREGPASNLTRDLSSAGATSAINAIAQSGLTVGTLAFRSSINGSGAAVTPAPSADGRIFVYPTQFYPAAMTSAQATTITLRPGEERSGVDLQLKLAPTSRVSGIVTGPDGPLVAGLSLTPSSSDLAVETGLETATTVSDANGRFTLLGVPAGHYVLRGVKLPPAPTRGSPAPTTPSGDTLWSTQAIAVDGADLQNVAVALRPGFRITGRLEFESSANQPEAAVVQRIGATLESADGRPMPSLTIGRGLVDATGQFSSYQLPAGRYLLRIATPPPGWSLKSAMLDSRDISTVPLSLDHDVAGLAISFTTRPIDLSGRVQNAAGARDATATVLIFPADSASWIDYGDNPRRPRAIRVDAEGAYRAVGLPAGDYLAVAISDATSALWQDPSTLQKLVRLATPIKLTEGETRSLELKTMAVPR